MIILFFAGILVVLAAGYLLYRFFWKKNLTASLHFVEEYVYEGDEAKITETIENCKKLPLPVVEVFFRASKHLVFHDRENSVVSDHTYKRDVFALTGYQRITRTIPIECTRRGYYHIDQVGISAWTLLHEQQFFMDQSVDTGIYVYAKRTVVDDISLLCEKIMGALQGAKRIYEDPFAFCQIREYTRNDPMKTINWKASARTGELMVNTFESTFAERVMLYLDLEDSGIVKRDDVMEEAISIAATLAMTYLHRGMEVGIAANPKQDASQMILPASGEGQLSTIEKYLASISVWEKQKESKGAAFPALLQDAPEDAVQIVITKNTEYQKDIEDFAKGQTGVVWVCPYDQRELQLDTAISSLVIIKRRVISR